MDQVMTDLKETIDTLEPYLKYLKDTYAQWIKINCVSFRPKYKKHKPIKHIKAFKLNPTDTVMYRKELFETIHACTYKYEFLIHSNGVTKITKYLRLTYADNLGRTTYNYIPMNSNTYSNIQLNKNL